MPADALGSQLIGLLQGSLHERTLTQGEVLVRENATSSALFVVDTGELSITVEGDRELGRAGSGAIVGEVAFLDGGTASATVAAATATRVWELERADFDALARTRPEAASEVLRLLCTQLSTRIRTASDRLDTLSQQPAQAKPTLLASLRSLLFGEP